MQKKKLHLELFEKLQVQFFETHKEPTGILFFRSGDKKLQVQFSKCCRCNFFLHVQLFSSSVVIANVLIGH